MTLLTIGYEGTTLGHVLAALTEAGAGHLLDARAVASSRKPGFSKTLLSSSLAGVGIGYTHLRGLGTPKAGREAVRHGDVAGMRRIYHVQLETLEAQADLGRAVEMARVQRCCLLCFERDHSHCHRQIVATLLCEATGAEVEYLEAKLPEV